jgi:hypothetical protein
MVSLNAIFNVLSNDVHGNAISEVDRHVGPAGEGHTQLELRLARCEEGPCLMEILLQ